MNTNGTNPGMNVEDYEDKAIQKSNAAKRMVVGGAAFLGGAAIAGGAAYAAGQQTENPQAEEALTTEDIIGGAEAGGEYQQAEEQQTQETHTSTHTTTEHVVIVEKPAAEVYQEEAQEAEEPNVTWDETTNYYVGDTKIGSIEEGTINGHKFALADGDGDGIADVMAIDSNNNNRFDDDEFYRLSESDNVRMGHETANVTNEHYDPSAIQGYDNPNTGTQQEIAQNEEPIYNNFEDEKTGESYHGDFAENNPDYNPNGFSDGNNGNYQYLAENNNYTNNDNYSADFNANDMATADVTVNDERVESYTAEADTYEDDNVYTPEVDDPTLAQADTDGTDNFEYDSMETEDDSNADTGNFEYDNSLADNDINDDENNGSFDSMMESEEFAG